MTFLKQNSKVLRDAAGEVLYKSDALIDLRSTFGVTKDVSNNVSKVKLFNQHSKVFRATSGNEPSENGDGFEFDNTNTESLSTRQNSNYELIGNFRFEFNIKTPNDSLRKEIASCFNPSDFVGWSIGLNFTGANDGKLMFYISGGSQQIITSDVRIDDNTQKFCVIERVSNTITMFADGQQLTSSVIYNQDTTNLTSNLFLGRDSNTSPTRWYIGSIYDFKLY